MEHSKTSVLENLMYIQFVCNIHHKKFLSEKGQRIHRMSVTCCSIQKKRKNELLGMWIVFSLYLHSAYLIWILLLFVNNLLNILC